MKLSQKPAEADASLHRGRVLTKTHPHNRLIAMSSPFPIKRRKLNDATATLKKPFVSPMRSADPTSASMNAPWKNGHKANVAPPPYIPSSLAHTVQTTSPVASTALASPALTIATATPSRKQPSLAWSSCKKKASPEEQAAQKAVSALEVQIRCVQKELDILNQAEQLATTSTDAELEALSEKWKLCSQAVAEELFGTVKERVQRMGGVAAWRETEKRKYERAHGMGEFAQGEEPDDDADCEFDSQGEELPEEEQEYRKKMKRQAKQEAMDAAEVPEQPEVEDSGGHVPLWKEENSADDDVSTRCNSFPRISHANVHLQSFTMDMMLRSLNIDLAVIGFDKIAQRWIT